MLPMLHRTDTSGQTVALISTRLASRRMLARGKDRKPEINRQQSYSTSTTKTLPP